MLDELAVYAKGFLLELEQHKESSSELSYYNMDKENSNIFDFCWK